MQTLKRTLGYTIDQTILIVAIIAILITIIIATVGLDLIAKTGGAKLAAQLRQIEDASNQFYGTHSQWPHQAINRTAIPTTNPTHSREIAYVLTGGTGLTFNSSIDASELRNYLTGLRVVNGNTANGTLLHDFGGGDADDIIYLHARRLPANTGLNTTQAYLVVEMYNVPATETLEADEAIDGDGSDNSLRAQQGRFFFRDSPTTCIGGGTTTSFASGNTKTVCYAANLIQ